MLQFAGKIIELKETQVISEKFSKREFVLDDGKQYPQQVQFQASQERCDLLDAFNVGDMVMSKKLGWSDTIENIGRSMVWLSNKGGYTFDYFKENFIICTGEGFKPKCGMCTLLGKYCKKHKTKGRSPRRRKNHEKNLHKATSYATKKRRQISSSFKN